LSDLYPVGDGLESGEGLMYFDLLWLVPVSTQIKVFTYLEFLCVFIVQFSESVLITHSISAYVHCALVNASKSTVNFETTLPKAIVVM
jgi:hypothetical protein